jgi:hypothetical protein
MFLDVCGCRLSEKFSGGVCLVQGIRGTLLWEELAESLDRGLKDHATVIAVAEMPVHPLSGEHIHRFVQEARQLLSDFAATQLE